jgi:hypothetical protein
MSKSMSKPKVAKPGKSPRGVPQVKMPTYASDTSGTLTIEFTTGERYESDVVYDKNSENFLRYQQEGHSVDNVSGWWRKYEISESQVTDTILIKYVGNNPDLPPPTVSNWYVERWVYELDPSWHNYSPNTVTDRVISGGVPTFGSYKVTKESLGNRGLRAD